MRQTLKLIYFNVAFLCVLLVGMELGGQVLFYLWKGYPVSRQPPRAEEHVIEQHPARTKQRAFDDFFGKSFTPLSYPRRFRAGIRVIRVSAVNGCA